MHAAHVDIAVRHFLAQGFGIPAALGGNGQPLPDTVVLNAAETAKISDRVNGYNSIIRTVAGEVGAALIESGPLLQEFVSGGVDIGGITYTSSFLTGGLFSYDGVHPSPFGYAYIANEYIKAINETYDASIPEVDLYPFIFGEFSLAPAAVTVAEARSAQLSPDAVSNLHWLLTSPDASAVKEPPRGRGKGGRGQGADDPATQDDEPSAIDQPDPTPRGRGGRSDF